MQPEETAMDNEIELEPIELEPVETELDDDEPGAETIESLGPDPSDVEGPAFEDVERDDQDRDDVDIEVV